MALEGKYGNVSVELGSIPDDEPVFLLRAQDMLAVPAIREYLDLCTRAGCVEEHLDGIGVAIGRFARWQVVHPDKAKLPGSPAA